MPKSVFGEGYQAMLQILVAARKEAKVTQVELAKRLNKPQPFVSYMERGERRLDVIEFCAVARAIGVDPASLFVRVVAALPEQLDI